VWGAKTSPLFSTYPLQNTPVAALRPCNGSDVDFPILTRISPSFPSGGPPKIPPVLRVARSEPRLLRLFGRIVREQPGTLASSSACEVILLLFRHMIGVDLFSGAGGMSLGASMSGVKVVVSVEANRRAAATYAKNHPGVDVLCKRVEQVRGRDLRVPRNEPIVLFGGPPCRGFSTSNQRTRSASNPNNWLFEHFIRIAKEIKPEWVVFENVTGILQTERGRFVEAVENYLTDLGYSIQRWVLNAADFGVPQRRSRLFLVGTLSRVRLLKPHISRQPVTVADAILQV
jgi:16S rRNA G966 N2-methylase RsmD